MVCTVSRAHGRGSTPGAQPIRSSRSKTSSGWSSRSRTSIKAEAFAHAFGFATALRTDDELHLRGSDAGAPCVLIRRGERSRSSSGRRFVAADDVRSGAAGRRDRDHGRTLPETLGGLTVDLVDPSGLPVRVVAGTHQLEALPTAQSPHVFNFGHELARANATQRPPRVPTNVQRLGHVVLQTTEVHRGAQLVPRQPRHDRQRLPATTRASASADR